MATVNRDSANWRLFGGGGMLAGGLVWLIGELVGAFAGGGSAALWIIAIGILLVGVAQFFVAFGQTGSNGAVGASVPGKIALCALGLGWVLHAARVMSAGVGTPFPEATAYVVAALVVLGGLAAAAFVYGRGVARGAARWVLFLPVLWSALFWASAFGWVAVGGWWLGAVLAGLFAITGLLYLLNRRDLG